MGYQNPYTDHDGYQPQNFHMPYNNGDMRFPEKQTQSLLRMDAKDYLPIHPPELIVQRMQNDD
jgi:hypothetical protein